MANKKTRVKGLIGCLMLFFVLANSAYGLSVHASANGAALTEDIKASGKDCFYSSISLNQLGASNTITGTADLAESHWVANKAGAYAEVGVDIEGATQPYEYSYILMPGQGGGKTASVVMACEDLFVPYASQVNAYAKARNNARDVAIASIEVTDGSLLGYHNSAWASADRVDASQSFDSASGFIKIESGSFLWGSDRIPNGRALGQWARILPEAVISTRVLGTVTNYADIASKSADSSQTHQSGHILGTLTSTASLLGSEAVTRNPQYGIEYDMQMQAAIGSLPTGTLAYYIDDDRFEIIQGAVDDSWSGDTINVKPGTYYENIVMDKSLTVNGAGAGSTILDGGQAGCVLTTSAHVDLSGMTIRNGLADNGGGIYNRGVLNLNDITISGNTAANIGGGIFNYGTVNMKGYSSIVGNAAGVSGGGIFNCAFGTVNMNDYSSINGNTANVNGGGICNDGGGAVNMNDYSSISGNKATTNVGGGIANYGLINMKGYSSIVDNAAGVSGGGIFNSGFGMVNMNENSFISGNTAEVNGGGICNNNYATVIMNDYSSISGNKATTNAGGGIANYGLINMKGYSSIVDNAAGVSGGGIFNSGFGMVNMNENSFISGNIAEANGGGICNNNYATVNMKDDSHISGNTAKANGGGIINYGTLNMNDDSYVSGNIADINGDDILNHGMLND